MSNAEFDSVFHQKISNEKDLNYYSEYLKRDQKISTPKKPVPTEKDEFSDRIGDPVQIEFFFGNRFGKYTGRLTAVTKDYLTVKIRNGNEVSCNRTSVKLITFFPTKQQKP